MFVKLAMVVTGHLRGHVRQQFSKGLAGTLFFDPDAED